MAVDICITKTIKFNVNEQILEKSKKIKKIFPKWSPIKVLTLPTIA